METGQVLAFRDSFRKSFCPNISDVVTSLSLVISDSFSQFTMAAANAVAPASSIPSPVTSSSTNFSGRRHSRPRASSTTLPPKLCGELTSLKRLRFTKGGNALAKIAISGWGQVHCLELSSPMVMLQEDMLLQLSASERSLLIFVRSLLHESVCWTTLHKLHFTRLGAWLRALLLIYKPVWVRGGGVSVHK